MYREKESCTGRCCHLGKRVCIGKRYCVQHCCRRYENKAKGNRIATFLLYLSDVEPGAGGGTVFTRANTVIPVMPYSAVFWYNLLPDGKPDVNTQHGGCPVYSDASEKW